jgi:hypothetical protein
MKEEENRPDFILQDSSIILVGSRANGRTRLEVRMQDETVWLTQAQMAELFWEHLCRGRDGQGVSY